jgi:DNA adenine methylase
MHISNQIKSFTYLGGKFSILPWMLEKLPPAKHFVDVFGGSGVVLLNREPSPIETYNDINGKVVNFFKVMRDQPDALIAALELAPYSRQEYEEALDDPAASPLERARRFFVRTSQSQFAAGAQEDSKGWACSFNDSRRGVSEKVNTYLNRVEGLHKMVSRLRTVQIENRCFRYVLRNYDTEQTLFYCDPPYMQTLRSSTKYEFDFANQDAYDLHYYASRVKGKIAISGYKEPFMMELYKDFNFHEGPNRKNNRSDKEAIECLWTNY